jgi:predicted naringenin-chalcone synthase
MAKTIAEIANFKIVKPANMVAQEDAIQWMAEARVLSQKLANGANVANGANMANGGASENYEFLRKRYLKYAIGPSKIAQRAFEVPDVGRQDLSEPILDFSEARDGPDLGKRSRFFAERSNAVLQEIYPTAATAPDHIIHVSCTGYVSPSAPQRLVSERSWNTQVTHAYHMGCYAAMPAVRMAQGFVANSTLNRERPSLNTFSTDVVHTEMCGLHFNPNLSTPEQIIVQSLFADGHIKYSLTAPGTARSGYRLHLVQEKIIGGTLEQMTWIPESWGFRMTLGRQVPKHISENVRAFVLEIIEKSGWDVGDTLQQAVFAVHPGGPRIVELIQETLELKEFQIDDSQEILKTRGNMSSATLPHIWERLIARDIASGTPVISLAFGPGLTVFGSLMTVI